MATTIGLPVSIESLESELVGLAGHLAAAHSRWLRLLAEFDEREGWAGPGLRSCAHWLSWRVGMSVRTGFEQVRVAHALTALPAISGAFAAGRVSYSKVRAITRIATPATEHELLELALAGTAGHVERVVRHARQAQSPPELAAARRELDWQWEDDGTLRLRGRFTAEQGARLLAALGEVTDRPPRSTEHSDGGVEPRPVSLAARRADALISLVTGDRAVNAEVVVVVDTDTDTDAAPRTRISGGPAVPLRTAERIGCTARVRAMLRDRRGNPLFLGRARRLVTSTQLTALRIRDERQCRFPGCEQTRYLDAHHVVPWMRGGRTDLENLALLCEQHHRLIHDHHYRVTGRGTELMFRRPDGRLIDPAGPPTDGSAAVLLEEHTDPAVTDETITPSWTGEALDLSAVLATLLPEPPAAAA